MSRFALVGILLLATAASAASTSVAVLPFKGAGAAQARRAVERALAHHPGVELLAGARGHAGSAEERVVLARSVGAALLIEGAAKNRGREIDLTVVDGATGDVQQRLALRARADELEPASAARLLAVFHPAVGELVALAPAPSPEPPAPVSDAPVEPAPRLSPPGAAALATPVEGGRVEASEVEPSRSRDPRVHPLFDLSVGGGVMRRTWSYMDDIFQSLDPYQLGAAASVSAAGEFYPGALAGSGWISDVGVVGRYEIEPGLSSIDSAGDRLSTLSSSWEAGLKVRVPLGLSAVWVSGSYLGQRFALEVPANLAATPILPGVNYRAAVGTLGGRIAFGDRVAAFAEASYLDVLSTGEVGAANYFPRLKVGAVGGQLGLALWITGPFEARAWADYRRYYYTLHPEPGDPYIAGGALDEYLTFTAAIGARW